MTEALDMALEDLLVTQRTKAKQLHGKLWKVVIHALAFTKFPFLLNSELECFIDAKNTKISVLEKTKYEHGKSLVGYQHHLIEVRLTLSD